MGLEVGGADGGVVFGRVMFCEVVGVILAAGKPVDLELALFHTVTHPVETHVDGFGAALTDAGVDDAEGGIVICF